MKWMQLKRWRDLCRAKSSANLKCSSQIFLSRWSLAQGPLTSDESVFLESVCASIGIIAKKMRMIAGESEGADSMLEPAPEMCHFETND